MDALERAKLIPGCIYMRPPIDPYGTLDFVKFDEIYRVGYDYGTKFLEEMKGKGLLPAVAPGVADGKREFRRTMAPRRASI